MKKIFILLIFIALGTSSMGEEKVAFSFFDIFKTKKEKPIEKPNLNDDSIINCYVDILTGEVSTIGLQYWLRGIGYEAF